MANTEDYGSTKIVLYGQLCGPPKYQLPSRSYFIILVLLGEMDIERIRAEQFHREFGSLEE